MADHSFAERVFIAGIRRMRLGSVALEALKKSQALLSLLVAERLVDMRSSGDPLVAAEGKIMEQSLLLRIAEEVTELLAERWDRVPERQRPHYTPEQRYRILRIKRLMAHSSREVASLFRVASATVDRWERDHLADPKKKTVGKLVRPNPPTRRYADVVRSLVQTMALIGFGGNELIARTLARAGWKLGATTVRNYRKEPTPLPPKEKPGSSGVVAKRPGHIWLSDITQLKGLFGLTRFSIVCLFDVYSRMPLATRTFSTTPTSADLASMFREAVKLHGAPRHFITDKGTQYTGKPFRRALRREGVNHQFGALGRKGSIAIMERFWLNLKVSLGRFALLQPLLWEDLDRAVFHSLRHYAFHRPHSALEGATPAEVYFRRHRAAVRATPPPRGRPGQDVGTAPFRIEHLDPEGRLPILVKAA